MFKDSPQRAAWNEVVWPLISALLGLYTLIVGETGLPFVDYRYSWEPVYTDVWRVSGAAFLWFAISVFLFAHYYLGNHDEKSDRVILGNRVGVILGLISAAFWLIGFIVEFAS